MGVFIDQQRFDGTRQFEIVIENPSFPNPFEAGTVRETLPSVYISDRGHHCPIRRGHRRPVRADVPEQPVRQRFVQHHQNTSTAIAGGMSTLRCPRVRPLSETAPPVTRFNLCRPDPNRGNILNLESTAGELEQYVRLNYRQRFSIFNVNAEYTWEHIRASSRPNNPAVPVDNYNLRADWGLIASPIHYLDVTANARLPLGLFLTTVVSANSGRRWTITTGRDDNRDTRATDRPPGVKRGSEDAPTR